MAWLRCAVVMVLTCLWSQGRGVTAMPAAQTVKGLGTVSFPTSTKVPEAQSAFVRGLLLLHVFEYADAAKSFKAAEALDPGFAMAYWGEAMTFNHPVWNQLDVPAGQEALGRFAATPDARAARVPDPRERAFLTAVEILYGGAGTKRERDARYADAMAAMKKAYPADDEVALFYSLALLGKSEGTRDVPVYLEAAAIAKAAFERNPDHPGAAHYWIHGMDDPKHAQGALVAARALSKIAPDAGHAQHMCSHIFMALGMWDEVVAANESAIRVDHTSRAAAGLPALDCYHYPIWLEYGYFQQGRMREGASMVAACQSSAQDAIAILAKAPNGAGKAAKAKQQADVALVTMRGIAVIESHDWDGTVSKMTIDPASLGAEAGWDAFVSGFAAARRNEGDAAGVALQKLKRIEAGGEPAKPYEAQDQAYLTVMEEELAGLISMRSGHPDVAVKDVEDAAAKYLSQPFDFGPPVVIKPPQELLGEMLLAKKDSAGAVRAFKASLELAPNRTQSLLGLARAEAAAGDKTASRAVYRQLIGVWSHADPGLAELSEARRGAASAE